MIVSKGGDKAFAAVYVDTLRQMILDGKDFHRHGRACKIYTKKTNGGCKMISHIGVLIGLLDDSGQVDEKGKTVRSLKS
jgi:hypothetical protein